MSRSVEFFFDVGSPASYLAWTQLPKICREEKAELIYRPMLLGGVFQATGNASPAAVPAKGRHSRIDMQRFAKRYGVTLKQNPYFPINTLYLMRATTGIQLFEPARFDAWLEAIFAAMWLKELNMNDPLVAVQAIEDGGFDPAAVERLALDDKTKATLRATTEEAVARGVFGAPTMFVGNDMFFGQDRLDFVREALA